MTRTLPVLAAFLCLSGAAALRADDLVEQTKKLNAVAAQKLEADVREALTEALQLSSRKQPAQAASVLKDVRVKVEEDRTLSSDRRQAILGNLNSRISEYETAAGINKTRAVDDGVREGILRERRDLYAKENEKNQALSRTMQQIAEMQRQGKFAESAKLADDLEKRYGRTPLTSNARRMGSVNDHIATMRGIKDERDRNYLLAMREVVKSSIPIAGEIEFPKNWRELTMKRLKPQITEEEIKLLKALSTPITAEVKSQPLQQVLDYLKKETGINFSVDKATLEAAGINYETPVTLQVRSVSARSAIKQMLAEVGLTFIIEEAKVRILTPEQARLKLVTRTYYVGDLLTLTNTSFDPTWSQLQLIQQVSALISYIQSIDPSSWQAQNGAGTIAFDPGRMAIIVRQTAEMHYMLQGNLR